MAGATLADVERVVRIMAETVVANETYFGDLDAVVGDGDQMTGDEVVAIFAQLDLRNRPLDPTAGVYLALHVEGGDSLVGGDFHYGKITPEVRASGRIWPIAPREGRCAPVPASRGVSGR